MPGGGKENRRSAENSPCRTPWQILSKDRRKEPQARAGVVKHVQKLSARNSKRRITKAEGGRCAVKQRDKSKETSLQSI